MKPSDRLVAVGQPEIKRWLAHPTVAGMADGTLPLETFAWWARQNYLYLIGYVRLYAKLAVAAPNEQVEFFVDNAHNLARIELGLLRDLGVDLGIDFAEPTIPTELNVAYQQFLLDAAEDFGVGLAAALPCLWGFTEMGRQLPEVPDGGSHPYARWLGTYQGAVLELKVKLLLKLLDETNTPTGRADSVVRQALAFEGRFWDVPHRSLAGAWK